MSSFNKPFRAAARYLGVGVMVASTLAFSQEAVQQSPTPQQSQGPSDGWPQAPMNQDPNPAPQVPANQNPYPAQQQPYPSSPQQPVYGQQGPVQQGPVQQGPMQQQQPYGQAPYGQSPYGGQPPYNGQQPYGQPSYSQPNRPIPAQLTIEPGTYVTVRSNQFLSSDRSQQGDAFSATLVQPIVVDGVVVAEPGQTIGGRVVEAQKAGRVEGTARLKVQLTDLSLVDGQQMPIQSQFISRTGPTSVGRDVGAVAGTTALGAAVGAAAGWGRGAAIGAGAGLVLGTVGVLVTRGQPSIIAPEQVLTFRLEAPVEISTVNSSQAFRYVQPGEYDRPAYANNGPSPRPYGSMNSGPYASGPGPYGPAPYPYYAAPYPYYAYGSPYYWGPGISLYYGRGFYGRPYYGGGRGFVGGRVYRR